MVLWYVELWVNIWVYLKPNSFSFRHMIANVTVIASWTLGSVLLKGQVLRDEEEVEHDGRYHPGRLSLLVLQKINRFHNHGEGPYFAKQAWTPW